VVKKEKLMKRTVLLCSGIAILLFIASFYWSDFIWDFLFSFFSTSNLHFVSMEINETFLLALKLSLSIAFVPLFLLVTWLVGNIILLRKRLFSIITVLILVFLAFAFNILRIQSHAITITNLQGKVSFPIRNLNFDIAIIAGTVIGGIVAYFIFRSKKTDSTIDANISEIGQN
jgi:hypothetical protein